MAYHVYLYIQTRFSVHTVAPFHSLIRQFESSRESQVRDLDTSQINISTELDVYTPSSFFRKWIWSRLPSALRFSRDESIKKHARKPNGRENEHVLETRCGISNASNRGPTSF